MKVLFACLEFFVPLENFSLVWRRQHHWGRVQIVTYTWHSWQLSSEIFFIACHTSCYMDIRIHSCLDLQGTFVECLVVELSPPVLTIEVCHGRDSNIQPSACFAIEVK